MTEEGYSNREIDGHFKTVTTQLDRIEAQTVKTNGRVSKLENWQNYVIGFCVCVSMFVVPLVIYVFFYAK